MLEPNPATTAPLATLQCHGDVVAQTLDCERLDPAGGASRTVLTYGGQHHYVRLSSEGTFYDSSIDALRSAVSVQNLLLVAAGTADGTTPDVQGVRVFISSGPTNGVTLANATGIGTFTASGQPYMRYSGSELGGDAILSPGESSTNREWQFAMNGATSFTFVASVRAEIPTGQAYSVHFDRIAGGGGFTCALTPEGRPYCWGIAFQGQTGDGVLLGEDRGVARPMSMPVGVSFSGIDLGLVHGCAIGSDGAAYCWGGDGDGQIGNGAGTTANQPAPVQVPLPGGVNATAVTAGDHHTCALASNLKTYCWGSDFNGELGNGAGTTGPQPSPTEVVLPGGVHFVAISAGDGHTCAIGSNGSGYCWGRDLEGQIGNGATSGNAVEPSLVLLPAGVTLQTISAGSRHNCGRGSDAKTYCWGWGTGGQLGTAGSTANQAEPAVVSAPSGVTFTSITTGDTHTCAIGSDTKAYCWGVVNFGRLGIGDSVTTDRDAPTEVLVPSGVTVTAIAAGAEHTCAVSGAQSYCWGSNLHREVGDGTWTDRTQPVVVAATR